MKHMATATVNLPNNVNRGVSSKATILGPEGAGEIEYTICPIHPGTTIRLDKLKATVVVIRPFVIELTPTEEGYMASSRISKHLNLARHSMRQQGIILISLQMRFSGFG